MATFVPNEAELDIAEAVRSYANTNWRIGLYKAISPSLGNTTVLADLTVAADTYTPGNLQTPVYGAASTVSGTAKITAADLTWTWASGSGETIIGYFIKNNATGKLIRVQELAAGQLMSVAGDAIVITDSFLAAGTIVA